MEFILSIVVIVLILALAWGGVLFGVFYELTSSLLLFFAMMVSLRYWYELARWIETVMPGAGSYGALGAYWVLFLLGCVPLILVLNRVTMQAVPRYPKIIDTTLGLVFGFISATILVCCVMTSLSVLVPNNLGALQSQWPDAAVRPIPDRGFTSRSRTIGWRHPQDRPRSHAFSDIREGGRGRFQKILAVNGSRFTYG